MQSHGWIPGSILGAASTNSNTDADFSYMRIKRREGNSGLGSSHQSQYEESHCLDAFQEILGRLNGRPEAKCAAVTTQSRDLKTANYVESRWRVLKFVSGGLLSKDKSEDVVNQPKKLPFSPVTQSVTSCDVPLDQELEAEVDGIRQQESMRSESSHLCESQDPLQIVVPRSTHLASSKRHKKRRKSEAGEQKKRKKRKEAIKKPPKLQQSQHSLPEEALAKPLALIGASQNAPIVQSSLSSRHAVRIRYIKHKKMVMKDRKALNEVCPIFRIRNQTQD